MQKRQGCGYGKTFLGGLKRFFSKDESIKKGKEELETAKRTYREKKRKEAQKRLEQARETKKMKAFLIAFKAKHTTYGNN